MANDPNDPNKKNRPVNGVNPPGRLYVDSEDDLRRSDMSDFESEWSSGGFRTFAQRAMHRARPGSAEYRELLEDIGAYRSAIKENQKAGNVNVVREMGAELAQMTRHKGAIDLRHIDIARNQISTYIDKSFSSSSVNGQVARLSRETAGVRAGLNMMTASPEQLERNIVQSEARIREWNLDAQRINKNQQSFNPKTFELSEGALAKQTSLERMRDEEIQKIAGYKAAQGLQRQIGLDPQSKASTIAAQYYQINKQDEQRNLLGQKEFDYKSSGDKDISKTSNLKFGLNEELKNLKKIMDDLAEATRKAAEGGAKEVAAMKELEEQRDASSKRADDMQKAADARGAQSSTRYDALQLLGGGFNAISNVHSALMVNQPMAKESNRAGLANWENQRYDTYRRARAGDYESQIALGMFDAAEKFGSDIRFHSQAAKLEEMGGGAAQSAAGMIQMGAAAESAFPGAFTGTLANATNVANQGLMQTLNGGATTVIAGSDWMQGITATQNELQARQIKLAADRAIIRNNAMQVQGFRDYGVGMGMLSMQMGAQGGAFMNEALSDKNLDNMVAARMSPEQLLQMSQYGIENIGSTFSMSQVYTAQNLNKAGVGTTQENMRRISQLASAGSNNPGAGLGSVLEAAFSKSLEGSKVLNMMVDHTATMAQQASGAAAMGVDTVGISAKILAGGIDESIKNKELALSRSADVGRFMQDMRGGMGMGFADQFTVATLKDEMGLKDMNEAGIAQLMNDQELGSQLENLKKGDYKSIATLYAQKGIDTYGKTNAELKKMVLGQEKGKYIGGLLMGGAGIAQNIDEEFLFQNRKDLEKMLKDPNAIQDPYKRAQIMAYNAATTYQSGGGVFGSEAARRNQALMADPNNDATQKAKDRMAGISGKEMTKEQRDAFNMSTSGATQAADAARYGAKAFGDAKKAFEALSKQAEDIEKRAAEYEKRADKSPKEAADKANIMSELSGAGEMIFEGGKAILEAAGILSKTVGTKGPASAAGAMKKFQKKMSNKNGSTKTK